jgi:hypothetical protein
MEEQPAQAPDKHGFVAHTPDPTAYHYPDGDHSRKMRGGIRAVMIPRATRHGASLGFKAGPGIVNIDPSDPETGEGGITLDMSQISVLDAYNAVATAQSIAPADIDEQILRAYQLMSTTQAAPAAYAQPQSQMEVRENPLMPNAYVVPASTPTGAQIMPSVTDQIRVPGQAPVPAPALVQAPVAARPEPIPVQPAPAPDPWAMVAALQQQMTELQSRVAQPAPPQQQPTQPAAPMPVRSSIPDSGPPRQSVPRMLSSEGPPRGEASDQPAKTAGKLIPEENAVKVIKDGFDALGIPGLSPVPNNPKFRVEFNLGQGGRQEAWYHWVGEHHGCLFLIYDTRFKFGMRYSPPNMGMDNPIEVRLPDHDQEYRAYSMDFVHPFGIFHVTNLVLVASDKDADVLKQEEFGESPMSLGDLLDDNMPEVM